MRGFQLWLNLPAAEKMRPVEYQDIVPERVPTVSLGEGATVKVIAGDYGGVTGPAPARTTQPLYLDVTLPKGAAFQVPVPADTRSGPGSASRMCRPVTRGHAFQREVVVLGSIQYLL